MTAAAPVFHCSICGELSTDICVYCTKDTCINHRCDRCKRCSDCCECEIPLSAADEPVIEQAAPETVTLTEAAPVEVLAVETAPVETTATETTSAETPQPESIESADSIWAPEPLVQAPIFEPQPPDPVDPDTRGSHRVYPPAEEDTP